MSYLFALTLALIWIVLGIVKLKIHPFFVLLLAAIGYGFMVGMEVPQILNSITNGFGGIMGKIGLLIFFGVVIGTVLEKSGGAAVIATGLVRLIGEKSIHLAMMLTGYFLSIPVFCDSAFIIMNSLNKSLSHKARVSYAGTTVVLAMGLMATHVMVPPTPGPIAAAGILNAPLGNVIAWGLVISLFALVPCYFFGRIWGSKIELSIQLPEIREQGKQPKLGISLMAIVVPILLIVLKSLMDYPQWDLTTHGLYPVVSFLGNPTIALLVGVILSLCIPEKLDSEIYSASGWFGEALKTSAPIIMITGAGGIFGHMLQHSGIADLVTQAFSATTMGIWVPFLIAAGLKTTQGSSTVALVTTASIMAPLTTTLGLDTPFLLTMTVLAIGAGATVVSHANDSFFWVVTQLTGMDVRQGNKTITMGTLILGISAMAIIYILTKTLA